MKKTICTLLISLIAVTAIGQTIEHSNRIVLGLKKDLPNQKKIETDNSLIGNEKVDFVNKNFGIQNIERFSVGRKNTKSKKEIYVVTIKEGVDIQQIIDAYYKTEEVEFAEPDYLVYGSGIETITPNDQYYSRQWGLKNDGSFPSSIAGADIGMEKAWGIQQGDSTVIVAVIDTGVKLDHIDLQGRIWINKKETQGSGVDDDANGYIEDIMGWDFYNNDNDPTDDQGHGTNVAGIIGAKGNNEIGYVGVDWNCKLMILKALNENKIGNNVMLTQAINYAVDNGAMIINLSLGNVKPSTIVENAINYALDHQVTVVACMMNDGKDTAYYPAAYKGVIAVGATTAEDKRARFSNYGEHISVVAPGNRIYGLSYKSDTINSVVFNGTSQAAPHVSGVIALIKAMDKTLTPKVIRSLLQNTADDQVGDIEEDTPGFDKYYGYGRINAYKVLSKLGIKNMNTDILENRIVAYPNPTTQNCKIVIPRGAKELQILNLLGQVLFSKKLKGETIEEYQFVNSGVYFIHILQGEQTLKQKVIVSK